MVRSFFFYLRIAASTIFFIDKFYRLQILDLSLFVIEGRSGDLGAKCIIVLIEFVLEVTIVREIFTTSRLFANDTICYSLELYL
jgi:hypothetical protein